MLLLAKQSNKPHQETSWLEWVMFGLGSVLLLGTLGLLIYEALKFKDEPPSISVVVDSVDPRQGEHGVPLTVRNTGGETAAAVEIQVTAYFRDGEQKQGHITFDFVPAHASAKGWVTFERPPEEADSLRARVLGYRLP